MLDNKMIKYDLLYLTIANACRQIGAQLTLPIFLI